jgi:hypothetical protein
VFDFGDVCTHKYDETKVGASHLPLVNTLNPEVKRMMMHMTIAAGEL